MSVIFDIFYWVGVYVAIGLAWVWGGCATGALYVSDAKDEWPNWFVKLVASVLWPWLAVSLFLAAIRDTRSKS